MCLATCICATSVLLLNSLLYIGLAYHYVEGGIVAGHNNVSCPWKTCTELIFVFLVELILLCSDFLTTEIPWSFFRCLWTRSCVKSSATL